MKTILILSILAIGPVVTNETVNWAGDHNLATRLALYTIDGQEVVEGLVPFRFPPPSAEADYVGRRPTSHFRLLPYARTVAHDFHISKCLVEYNEGEQALQMSLHLFIDDLEEALSRQGNGQLFLCTKKEHEEAEQYIYRYLQQHFQFEVNGKAENYTFIGKEVSEDLMAVWCYLEITGVSTLQAMKVQNSILLEVFDDQKNLVSISGPAQQQGLMLFQKGDTVKEAQF